MHTLSPLSARPTLPTLATELVEIVSHCLVRSDLLSLRLVCKELHQKTLRAFGTLLATICIDLSQASFQRLRVLGTPELKHYVKKLLIESGEDGKLGQDLEWRRLSSTYLDVLSPGPQMLQHLLLYDLPNCRSLHIRSPGGMEDESDALTHSDVVGLILLLIPLIANTSPVSSFRVDSRVNGKSFMNAKKLPMSHCRQPWFLDARAHLRELILEQDLTPEISSWALDLVLHAPRLRVLSLVFGFTEAGAFIERLCTAESGPRSLESLSLARALRINVAHLSQLIEQCRQTLRELCLRFVMTSRVNHWRIALRQLSSQAPVLERICIEMLLGYNHKGFVHLIFPGLVKNHVVPGSGGRSVTWTRTMEMKGKQRVFEVEYQGPCMGNALGMLLKTAEWI